MFGALTKSYFAEKEGIDPNNIITVSIVPCTAKKVEAEKDYQQVDGIDDIDYVLTTRELAKLMKDMKTPLTYEAPREEADHIMADYSGAGTIFGTTGGVMTAALRMAYKAVEGKELENIEFTQLSTLDGVKIATIPFGGKEHKIAVVNGTVNFDSFMKKYDISQFTFIEVMACNGGCIAGGGQPFLESTKSDLTRKISRARIASLRGDDINMKIRHPQDNPMVKKMYDEYLGEPNGDKAHHLLHVHKHQGN